MELIASAYCGALKRWWRRCQDRDVGVLDLIRHGMLQRRNAAVDLGDGQSGLEAQHDLDKDDATGAPRPDTVEPLMRQSIQFATRTNWV
jgi:hypothetical protein